MADVDGRLANEIAVWRADVESAGSGRYPHLRPADGDPRAVKHFQRTRWQDGRVVVWLGARKQVGRGEGSSDLAFDRAMPTPQSDSR